MVVEYIQLSLIRNKFVCVAENPCISRKVSLLFGLPDIFSVKVNAADRRSLHKGMVASLHIAFSVHYFIIWTFSESTTE